MKLFFKLIVLSFILVLASNGCSSMKIEDFADKTPRLTFEQFFVGKLKGHGLFFDRFNNVRRAFTIDMVGTKTDSGIRLDEYLVYDDGEKLTRVYEITKTGKHTYSATADGLVDPAQIESYGNALRWSYTLEQKIGDKLWKLNFDDWMFLQSNNLLLNRGYVTKFGLDVGEVFMSVEKLS